MNSAVVQMREPLVPIATDIPPQLSPLTGIQAVVFDVYGTLLISGSGEVGSAENRPHPVQANVPESEIVDPVGSALKELGIHQASSPTRSDLEATIRRHNETGKTLGRPSPEVEILQVWRETLKNAGHSSPPSQALVNASCTMEAIANPTWPMRGAAETLDAFSHRKFKQGIVSNAQFFTIDLVESLTGTSLNQGPFDLDLCVFSNRYRQSKPGPRLFEVLVRMLERFDIHPDQAIYVGNDMLNDVWAAQQAGLKTAWFVGDARSARRRDSDERCRSISPDLIVTDLRQLIDCVG